MSVGVPMTFNRLAVRYQTNIAGQFAESGEFCFPIADERPELLVNFTGTAGVRGSEKLNFIGSDSGSR